jgi:hypothetical protein
MSFATLVQRARADFIATPRLELTLPQAVRLWGLGFDDCRFLVDALVDARFLMWTPRRTLVRYGQQPLSARSLTGHIPVRPESTYDNVVGRD